MRLVLSQKQARSLRQHGERCFPYECCGVVLGRIAGDRKVVLKLLPAENVHDADKRRRFLIAPYTYLEAERHAERSGMEILGFYHSHPNHPARPSPYDLEHAWPGCSYIIISVQEGRATEITSWQMREDRSQFDQETLLIGEEPD